MSSQDLNRVLSEMLVDELRRNGADEVSTKRVSRILAEVLAEQPTPIDGGEAWTTLDEAAARRVEAAFQAALARCADESGVETTLLTPLSVSILRGTQTAMGTLSRLDEIESTDEASLTLDSDLPPPRRLILADEGACETLRSEGMLDSERDGTGTLQSTGTLDSTDPDGGTGTLEDTDRTLESTGTADPPTPPRKPGRPSYYKTAVVPFGTTHQLGETVSWEPPPPSKHASSAKKDKSPPPGQLLSGKYRLLRPIGTGGFGAVYEAVDEILGSRVAIKVLNPQAARTQDDLDAFKAEARRVTQLSHPNIVDWKSFDEAGGRPYFVMELLEGEELHKLMKREGPLPAERVLHILLQTVDALRTAHHRHAEAILHLDIKPQNVFICHPSTLGERERVKVIDFGIGQYVGGEEFEGSGSSAPSAGPSPSGETTVRTTSLGTRSTSSSEVRRSSCCTPEYASPEQCAHLDPDAEVVALDGRSDLYSVGIMGYRMLTGEFPFDSPGRNRRRWLEIHREVKPRLIRDAKVDCPRGLAEFIDRCLHKDREQRWASTSEAYDFLYSVAYPSPLRLVAKVAALLTIVFATTFGLYLWLRPPAAEPFSLVVASTERTVTAAPLWLGPQQAERELLLPDEWAGAKPSRFELVSVPSGEPLTQWRCEAQNGRLLLKSPIPEKAPTERFQQTVAVRGHSEGQRYESESFEVVYLGNQAWSFEENDTTLFLGETAADSWPDSTVRIDPEGVFVNAKLPGAEAGDVLSVTVTTAWAASADEQREVAIEPSPAHSGVGFRARLSDLIPGAAVENADDDANRLGLTIRATGRAGTTRAVARELLIVENPLSFAEAPRLDGAVLFGAGRYQVAKGASPRIRVHTTRESHLRWSIHQGQQQLANGSNEPTRVHDIPLNVSALRGEESFDGAWLELEAQDLASVWHADPTRGRTLARIDFFYTAEPLEVALRWTDVVGLEKNLREQIFLGGQQGKLVLERTSAVAVRAEVRWFAPGTSEARVWTEELPALERARVEIPWDLPDEGLYRLQVDLYRRSTGEERVGETPEFRSEHELIVKHTPGVLQLEGVEDGVVFATPEDWQRSLTVRLDDPLYDEHEIVVPGTIRASLKGPSGRETRLDGPSHLTPDQATSLDLGQAMRDSGLPDGHYEITVTGVDEAGNEFSPVITRFEYAGAGPRVDLLGPNTQQWVADPSGSWAVRLEIRDPNGLGEGRPTLTIESAKADATPVELELEEDLSTRAPRSPAGVHRTRTIWKGAIDFGPAWSKREIHLSLRANDRHGNVTENRYGPHQLPEIEWRAPSTIVAKRADGIPLEPMAFLPRNSAAYVFGGRNDEVENKLFEQAGLNPYDSKDTTKAWRLIIEPGKLAGFYLDIQEVSRAQFHAFTTAGDGSANPQWWPGEVLPEGAEARRKTWESALAPDDPLPVTGVTWAEAFAYARWAGKRLPTWFEWEYAVRGGDQYRPYPGYRPDGPRPTADDINHARPTGASWKPGVGEDRTPEGIFNLAGNVREWTASPRYLTGTRGRPPRRVHYRENLDRLLRPDDTGATQYLVVGGSYRTEEFHFGYAAPVPRNRAGDPQESEIGFRCAIDARQVQAMLDGERSGGTVFSRAND